MGVKTTNLLQGPVTLYTAAFGAVEPTDANINTAPDNTVWTDVGGTQDGLEVGIYEDYSWLEVDQLLEKPEARRTSREVRFGTNLAEATIANLALAINDPTPAAGTAPVAAALSPITAFIPTYRAFLWDGLAPGGFRRRVIVRKAINTADVKLNHKKDDQTLIPIEFTSLYVSTSIPSWRWIDASA